MAGPVTLLRPGHVHLAPAGGPDTEPMLILAPQGRTWIEPADVVAQAGYFDTLPFDGFAITPRYVWDTVAGGVSFNEYNWDPSNHANGVDPLPMSYAAVCNELKPFQAALGHKKNFLMMFCHRMPDVFDDTWGDYIAQQKVFAQAANDLGYEGIAFDNEEYFHPDWANRKAGTRWNYRFISTLYPKHHVGNPWGYAAPGGGIKDEAAYLAQARVRGNEFMAAIKDAFAARTAEVPFFCYHPCAWAFRRGGPSYTGPNGYSFNQLFPWWGEWSIYGGFFSGMMQAAAGSNIRLIDGGELYGYRTAEEYADSYEWTRNRLPAADKTAQGYGWLQPGQDWSSVGIGFMQYNLSSPRCEDGGGTTVPAPSAAAMEGIIRAAMERADRYTVFYTEFGYAGADHDWTNPAGASADDSWHKAWVAPLAQGRAAAKASRGF